MGNQNPIGGDPVPVEANAEVIVAANWPQNVVDSITQNSSPVLTVVALNDPRLDLRVVIDDLRDYVGIGQPVPATPHDQEDLVIKIVRELLGPVGDSPGTDITLTALQVG